MGLFTPKIIDEELESQRAELKDEIAGLRGDIQGLLRQRTDLQTVSGLEEEIARLKAAKVDLELNADRTKEQHDRKLREVEHAVGLQQKTATFEQEKATQEATLKVREENLAAERAEFERQLTFNTEQLTKVQEFMQTNFSAVLNRLPTVTVDVNPGAKNGNASE